jgi:hypothetical protein
MRPRVADIGDQPHNRAGLDLEHFVSERRISVGVSKIPVI